METGYLKDYRFYVHVSALTLIAGILTLIITQIIKVILKKKKIIEEGMEESKKDEILSRIGRIVALVTDGGFYIGKEAYFKQSIIFDEAFIAGLLTGATLTITVAKGIYTMLHQWSQKKNIYERLEYAEEANRELNEAIGRLTNGEENEETRQKWTLTHKQSNNQEEKK